MALKSLLLKELIKDSGNNLLYTVSYNPQTNPIVEFFSQIRHNMRKKSPQNYKEIYNEIKNIFETKAIKLH